MTVEELRQLINAGAYQSKLPWPEDAVLSSLGKEKLRKNREMKEAHKADDRRLMDVFKSAAIEAVGLKDHAKAEKVWHKAWECGHSSGLYEVLIELEELAELVL